MHQWCKQYLSSQLLAKCPSSLKQEHRKPNSAVAQSLAAATGNLFAGCFSSIEEKQNPEETQLCSSSSAQCFVLATGFQ